MNREQRKDILETVGFGAIVASLIFVALEVSQNTSQMRVQAAYSVNEGLEALNASQYGDPSLVDLLLRGEQDLSDLDPIELARFERYQFTRLNLCEFILGLENEGLSDVHISYVEFIVRDFNSKPGLAEWITLYEGKYGGSDEFYLRLTASQR